MLTEPRAERLSGRAEVPGGSSPRRARTWSDTTGRSPRAGRCARVATTRWPRAPLRGCPCTRSRRGLPGARLRARRACSWGDERATGRNARGRALLVEGGPSPAGPRSPRNPFHICQHRAQGAVAGRHGAAVAPALDGQGLTNAPASAFSSDALARPVVSKRCISSRNPSSWTARRSSSGSMALRGPRRRTPRRPRVERRRASRLSASLASSVWNSRRAEPSARTALAVARAGPAPPAWSASARRASWVALGTGSGTDSGGPPGQEQDSQHERHAQGNERQRHRVAELATTWPRSSTSSDGIIQSFERRLSGQVMPPSTRPTRRRHRVRGQRSTERGRRSLETCRSAACSSWTDAPLLPWGRTWWSTSPCRGQKSPFALTGVVRWSKAGEGMGCSVRNDGARETHAITELTKGS